MSDEEKSNQRYIPLNELDLAARTLDTSWGREATTELYNALKNVTSFVVVINSEGKVITNEDGDNMVFLINNKSQLVDKEGKLITNDKDEVITLDAKESAWGLISYYNKDLRLGFIKDNEVQICQYYLDLAGDCLTMGYPKAFQTALRRAITLIELSQSRDGNLRKNQITIKQDIEQTFNKPKKKGLLGGKD